MKSLNDENIREHYRLYNRKLLPLGYTVTDSVYTQQFIHYLYTNTLDKKRYQSIYVKEPFRGKGIFDAVRIKDISFVAHEDCNLKDFFQKRNVLYRIESELDLYDEIEEYYGNNKSKRTDTPLIYHIYEGVGVLIKLIDEDYIELENPFDLTKLAQVFANHPLYQTDMKYYRNDPFINYYGRLYASVANMYQRKPVFHQMEQDSMENFLDSCLQDDNLRLLLAADKIQNYKAAKVNSQSLEEWEEIEKYFLWWFDRLKIKHSILNNVINFISLEKYD